MHLDVINLRGFYYRTVLGRTVQQAIRVQITNLWPNTEGMTVAGFGFAAPMMRPFLEQSRRVLCFMPGGQGVMHWPVGEPNCSVLVPEFDWPIASGHIDRLIVLHGLETSDHPTALLNEIWRVLAPGGRVVFVVPNRTGLWARSDATPFGYGRPYSLAQLETQLKAHEFYIERLKTALYAPPKHSKLRQKMISWLEKVRPKFNLPIASGVLLVEATKQVFAPTRPGLAERVRRPMSVIEGLTNPAPEPVSGRMRDGQHKSISTQSD